MCRCNLCRAAFKEQAVFITPYVERRRICASNIGRWPSRSTSLDTHHHLPDWRRANNHLDVSQLSMA